MSWVGQHIYDLISRFRADVHVEKGIRDKDGDIGTSGQILSSTGTQVNWIDNTDNEGVTSVSGTTNRISSSGGVTPVIDAITGTVTSSSANLATGSQIKTAIDAAVATIPSGLKYQGTWNASTNSPALASGTGVAGYYYVVSVAGSTNLDGITDWKVGDWAIFTDHTTDHWQKLDQSEGDTLQSVTTRGATSNQAITLNAALTGTTATFSGNVDVNGSEITVGNNGSIFAENNIRFKSSGAAYIDHNTTSQSIKFRLSSSSSLDVTPFEITPTYMVSTTDMYFGDSDKIRLGAGSDLQLYHDGSNSYIDDTGVGLLYIRGDAGINITAPSGGEVYAKFVKDAGCEFRYNDGTKLVTTNIGIEVTGEVFAQGNLIAYGGSSESSTISSTGYIQLRNSGNTNVFIRSNGNSYFNGGNFGIGTVSPQRELHIHASNHTDIQLTNDTTGVGAGDGSTISVSNSDLYINNKESANTLLYTANTERARITSGGNLLIGTTVNSGSKLVVADLSNFNSSDVLALQNKADQIDEYVGLSFQSAISSDGIQAAIRSLNGPSSNDVRLGFFTSSTSGASITEGMSISHSGNVGINQQNPLFKLQVSGSVALDVMPTNQSEGIVRIGRYDANTSRYNDIKSYVSSTSASNYLKFSVHDGTENSVTDVLILNGDDSATFKGLVSGIAPTASANFATKGYVDTQVATSDTLSEVLALGNTSGANDIAMDLGQKVYFNNANENIYSNVNGDLQINARTELRIKANSNNDSGNSLEFWNGGSEKMRLTSGGNLGIGTSSPTAKLEIAGTGNQKFLVNRTDGDNFFIDAQNGQIRMRGSDNIYMGVSGDLLSITNTAIGIGTTSPGVRLEVADSIPALRITGTRNASWTIGQTMASLEYFSEDASGSAANSVRASINLVNEVSVYGSTTGLAFSTKGDVSGAPLERLRIANSGNVGIFNTNPTVALEVGANSTGNTKRVIFNGEGGNATNLILKSRTNRSTLILSDNDTTAYFVAEGSKSSWGFGSNIGSANNILIDSSGNVAIGSTITNSGAKLHVTGNSLFTGNITLTASSGHPILTTASGKDLNINSGTNNIYINGNPTISGSLTGTTATFSGEVQIASGNVLGWGGNNNFIFGDSSNNYVSIGTNGSQKMRITSAGRLGVGVTNPDQLIHAQSSSDTSIKIEKTGGNYIQLTAGGAGGRIISDHQINFDAGGNSGAMLISSSGNTSLTGSLTGTSATFNGNLNIINGSGLVTFASSSSGDLTIDAADDIRLDAGGGDVVLRNNGTEFGRISTFSNSLRLTSSVTNEDIILQPNGTGQVIVPTTPTLTNSAASKSYVDTQVGASDTLQEVTDNGNSTNNNIILSGSSSTTISSVGINNTSNFDISSAGIISFTIGSEKMRLANGGQLLVGNTTGGYSGTKIHVGNFSDSQNGINILTSTTGYGYVLFGDSAGAGTYRGQVAYYHGDDSMIFNANGGERLRIVSGGGIAFGGATNYGTSGQILKSNASTSPTWVDASSVIGGPYLPLTGGTLTGSLTGTTATFTGELKLYNGSNYWSQSVDGSGRFLMKQNNSTKVLIDTTGKLTLSAYAGTSTIGPVTYLLGTDISGNVTKVLSSGPGSGVYLPLTGGTMSGTLGLSGGDAGVLLKSFNTSQSNAAQLVLSHVDTGVRINNARGALNFQTLNTTRLILGEGSTMAGTLTVNGLTSTTGTFSSNLSIGGTLAVASTSTFSAAITGTTATFTGLVSGIAPTSNANLATKLYVDTAIGTIPAGLTFEGNWNASTDTPSLAGTTPANGIFYIVSVNGSTSLSGITDWKVGDWAVYVSNGGGADAWQKIDNTSTLSGAGVSGQLAYWNGTTVLAGDSDATFDGTNLNIGGTITTSKAITTEVESASTILLDAAADITIDAGGGDIILSDDATIFGTISSSGGMQIRSRINNADMFLRGVDDGTEFNALTLDMSDGGWATFNSGIHVANTFSPSTFGKATFAGNVTAGGNLFLDDNNGASPYLQFTNGDNNYFKILNSSAGKLEIYQANTKRADFSSGGLELVNGLVATSLDINGAADISGNVSANNLNLPDGHDLGWAGGFSSNKPTLAANGTTMKMYPGGSSGGLQFSLTTTAATFAGDVKLTLSATTQRALSSTGTDSLQIGDAGVNDIRFKNAVGSVARFLANGNVLIGTTTDYGKKLYVNGSAQIFGPVTVDSFVSTNTAQLQGSVMLSGSTTVLNKAQTAYIPLFTKNTSGSEVAYDITNVGTATFSGLVSGITPTSSNNLATKSYVDAHGGGLGPFLPLTGGTLTGDLVISKSVESQLKVIEPTNNHTLQLYQQASESYIIAGKTSGTPTQNLRFYTGGSDSMILTAGGNLGIGTTSPTGVLHVKKTDSSTYWLGKFEADGTTQNALLATTDTDAGTGVRFDMGGSTGTFTVLNNGKIGIGTAAPATKFHVVGRARFDDSQINAKGVFADYFSSGQNLTLNSGASANILFLIGGGSEKMRLTSTGLAIGSTSANGKLNITQSSATEPVLRLTDDGVADYDFIFPDTNTLKLETNTTSTKTFKLLNAGTGGFNLEASEATFSGLVSGITPTAAANFTTKAYVDGQISANDSLEEVTNVGNSTSHGIEFTSTNFSIGQAKIGLYSNNYVYLRGGSSGLILAGGDGAANFRVGTNYQMWEIGSSEKMRLNNAGRLGIGTSSPSGLIHAKQTASDARIIVETDSNGSNSAGAYFEAKSEYQDYHGLGLFSGTSPIEKWFIGSFGSSYFSIINGKRNDGTKVLNVTTDNRVGIGTTTPAYPLDIVGFANSTNGFRVTDGTIDNRISWASGNVGFFGTISNHSIAFYTGGNERARITAAGNVGIGTNTPTNTDYGSLIPKLHTVQASTTGSFNLVARFQAGTDANDTGGAILINHSNDRGLLIEGGRGGAGDVADDDAISHLGLVQSNGSNTRVITIRQKSVSNGSLMGVGIGTTSPSFKLDVEGASTSGIVNVASFVNPVNAAGTGHGARIILHSTTDAGRGVAIASSSENNYAVNNAMLFYTGVSSTLVEKMRLTAGGNLGIGTTSPSATLHVIGNAGATTTIEGSTQSTLNLKTTSPSKNNYIVGTTAGDLSFRPNGLTSTTLKASGNVGIGTTAPAARLHIVSTDGSNIILNSNTGAENNGIFMTEGAAASPYTNGAYAHYDSVANAFKINTGTSSLTTKFTILRDNGNVGIGTTAPTTKLNVVGGIAVNSGSAISFIDSNLTYNTIKRSTSVGGLQIDTGGSASMNILDSGNLGIGTTNPLTKLDVNGIITAGGKITYRKSAGSLNTTGYAVAGLLAYSNGNGQSGTFIFTCGGGANAYQKIVYSVFNVGGTWTLSKVIDEGTNHYDVTYTTSAVTGVVTFTFKTRSGTQSYTPQVLVEHFGSINTYINYTYGQ